MDPAQKKLVYALACAAVSAGLAWAYLEQREQALLHRGQEVKVLAAKRYVPAFARLEPSHLTWKALPAEYAPPGAVAEAEEALGMHTLVPFNPGEPLVFNKLAEAGPTLSSAIPEGKRAVSLSVDDVTGVSQLIRPGDHVDVFFLPEEGGDAGVLFQGAAVLALGQDYTRKEDEKRGGNTVTLALAPDDAELALYASAHGILHLGLRPSGDSRPVSLGTVGKSDLLRRLGSQRQSQDPPSTADEAEFIPRKR